MERHQACVSNAKRWNGWLLGMLSGEKSRRKSAYVDFVSMGDPEEIERFFSLKNLPPILLARTLLFFRPSCQSTASLSLLRILLSVARHLFFNENYSRRMSTFSTTKWYNNEARNNDHKCFFLARGCETAFGGKLAVWAGIILTPGCLRWRLGYE